METTVGHSCGPRMLKTYLDRVTAGRFQELGVTVAEAQFLGAIHHHEGASLKELSELLSVDKSHVTRTVTDLIEKGLVENTASGHAYSLRLTEEGERTGAQVKAIVDDAWEHLLEDLTSEERDTMDSIIWKITQKIKEAQA